MCLLHGLLLIISSSHLFWGNIIFSYFTLIELDISEVDEPWSYLWLMLILILFWLLPTFSVTLTLQEYVFSVKDVQHDSKETEFGRFFSISHYKYCGSFSVMPCMEMCRDRQDQERTFFHFATTFTMLRSREKKLYSLVTTFTTL